VRERIGPYEYVWDKLRPDIDVITEEQYRGPTPSKQFEQENVVLMADSQEAARLVVLRRLGYPVIDRGALVEALTPGFPSGAVLKPKDLIVAIDGRPVTTAEQAVAAINGHHIGDPIALRIVRGAQTLDVQTRIGAGQGGAPKLGVSISTKVQYPFVVNIDSGNVTGPSAGLAFALELLDKLTPGELTGGASVAATGDLGTDGSVQPIGGAAQKAAAVRARGHIEVFLVPRDGRHEEYREAKAHVGPGVRVYEVGTFDDALRVLATLPGSDAAKYLAPPGSGH
jgi:PDZ domain-containing protein